MAKLVDALDLGSSGVTHRSSSLLTRTITVLQKKPPNGGFVFYCASGPIAETGQTAAQVPHEIHFCGSITHLPSAPILIAPTGQIPIHVPQPIHLLLSILYAIFYPFFNPY